MIYKRLFIPFILLAFTACKTNQTINHVKEGKWVYKDIVNGVHFKSKGKYIKGREVKTWRYYENHKLVKVERYRDSICTIKTYGSKGRIASKGQSWIIEEKDGVHWYITGNWYFYDEHGKLIGIKNYLKGELISETEVH